LRSASPSRLIKPTQRLTIQVPPPRSRRGGPKQESAMEYSYRSSGVVAEARPDARAAFIRRTYAHLAGAILAFAGVEALLLQLPISKSSVMCVWALTLN